MGEWKRVRIGDVCRVINGRAYSLPELLDEGKYRILRVGNFFTSDRWYYSDMELEPDKYCERGDLLFAWSASFGPRIWDGEKVIYHYHIWKMMPDESLVDKRWLYYWLLRSCSSLTTGVHGSVMAHMTKSEMELAELQLPDLPTQRRIAAVLGALDDKIEVNRKICENLEAQAQALFKAWFVDFEPFGGKCPAGWKMGKLGDVADCNPYRKLEKGVEATCVEMADLVTNGSFPSGCSTRVYNGGMKFTNGDTIIARITPCFENGKAAFVNFLKEGEVAFGSTEYVVIASKSAAPSGMFYSLVKTPDFLTYAKSRMVGSSGRQRFSASDVAEYPMVIATNDAYEKLAPVYDFLMSKIAQCGRESRALAAMRDALLPKLMSGELAVEKVEG